MRIIKAGLCTIVIAGLLAGSTAGATAQEAPVEFTATWGFGPKIKGADDQAVRNEVTKTRGEAWRPTVLAEATDDRFSGDLSIALNHDAYADGSTIGAMAFAVTGEEGSWIMEPALSLNFPGTGETRMINSVFVGDGAYDGLLALVNIETVDQRWELRGYIVGEDALPTVEAYVP